MDRSAAVRFSVFALFCGASFAVMAAQARREEAASGCPTQPNTLRAMRNCYRPLLVFAPSLDNPKAVEQLNQLKANPADLESRNMLYVPVLPEGHNQPIPDSRVPTAGLSEDELAATRHRFKVDPSQFLVVLLGKDGGEKLTSPTPVPMDKIKELVDSKPMRNSEMQDNPQGDE